MAVQAIVPRNILVRLAAKRYAARLGPQLVKGWGGGEFYTPQQIRSAACRARLPIRYLRIGYAAFLRLEEFVSVVGGASADDYEGLRALYRRYLPSGATDPFSPASENAYLDGGTGGMAGPH
jgi:hypothetical protein